ncbi:sensor domain-containing diguanylate cyclase [Bhargavaea beijingensis]|nr:diguanylate cyclase [Bhargavaea beijingensis]MCW1927311.1 diguanylate cyclase [Bhargavaea beijingensis]SDE10514.1 diguanylate cyclase (GGDEF) domain-containing protein [Bhargavaea beijingensis]
MDAQLDRAPVGYVILDKEWNVLEVNRTFMEMAGLDDPPKKVRDMLTVSGWVYFQTFFMPAIELHGRVKEMEISLRCRDGRMPALLSAAEASGCYECAILPMPIRGKYEEEMMDAKREAERVRLETEQANSQLMGLVQKIQNKQDELIQLTEQFRELASTDPLTGLANRRAFEKQMDRLAESPYAVIALDIDHFKQVNDTYGHAVGDDVLKRVATAIEDLAEETRSMKGIQLYAARIGGEEFSLTVETASETAAASVAERIRKRIAEAGKPVPVTVSAGVALRKTGEEPALLLKRADEALYRSKREGRNRVTVGS